MATHAYGDPMSDRMAKMSVASVRKPTSALIARASPCDALYRSASSTSDAMARIEV